MPVLVKTTFCNSFDMSKVTKPEIVFQISNTYTIDILMERGMSKIINYNKTSQIGYQFCLSQVEISLLKSRPIPNSSAQI